MCRWIAYAGRTIPLEHYVTEPSHSLVSQSIAALESTAATNGDGFGLGWYGDHPEPGRYREVQPAWSDDNLRYLCRHLRSHLFFAHVRAATGTPITRPNCHPFACGPWLFMHNGYIGDWSRLRRPVEALIPDELYPSRAGTTDSEAIFLGLLGCGLMGPGRAAIRSTRRRARSRGSRTSPERIRSGSRRRWRTAAISTRSGSPRTTRRTRSITAPRRTAWWSPRSRSTGTTAPGRRSPRTASCRAAGRAGGDPVAGAVRPGRAAGRRLGPPAARLSDGPQATRERLLLCEPSALRAES